MDSSELGGLAASLPQLLAERERRAGGKFRTYFPEDGPLSRHAYPKHMAFFAAGKTHRERAFVAANRAGKTSAGVFEDAAHLTGQYPPWWEGRRFRHPIEAWVAGDTSKTTRDILQSALLGPPGQPAQQGTGMLPKETILHTTPKAGIANAVETVYVRHVTGGTSTMTFKSFDQRREAFQGTAKHLIHLDEEADEAIYAECLLRTMETGDFTGGIIILTFTPLMGLTPLVLSFMPGGQVPAGQPA